MPPLTATTLHSLQVGMNQSPIIFLQDALMQDWQGSAQNLATTANLKFQGRKPNSYKQTKKEQMEKLPGRRRNWSPCEFALRGSRKDWERKMTEQ